MRTHWTLRIIATMHIPDLSEPAKVDSDCRNVIHILDPSEGPMVQKT